MPVSRGRSGYKVTIPKINTVKRTTLKIARKKKRGRKKR